MSTTGKPNKWPQEPQWKGNIHDLKLYILVRILIPKDVKDGVHGKCGWWSDVMVRGWWCMGWGYEGVMWGDDGVDVRGDGVDMRGDGMRGCWDGDDVKGWCEVMMGNWWRCGRQSEGWWDGKGWLCEGVTECYEKEITRDLCVQAV